MRLLMVGLLLVFIACTSASAEIIIDNFVSPHSSVVSAAAPPNQSTFTSAAAGSAIGGERDLLATKTVGALDDLLRARVNPNGLQRLRISQDTGVLGTTAVVWDGVDGAQPIVFNGLGSVDFTGEQGIEIVLSATDLAASITVTLFDANGGGADFATGTFAIPGAIGTPTAFFELFTDFTVTGGASLTDILDSVGAIRMVVDGTGGVIDYDINSIRATVPEPSGLALLGLASLSLLRRRRRAAPPA